jgi:uncharacterized protein
MDLMRSVFVDMWPGWVGGAAISGVALVMLLARNRQLSVSFCYGYAIDRVSDWVESFASKPAPHPALPMPSSFPMPSSLPIISSLPMPSKAALARPAARNIEPSWSMVFLAGILLGGVMAGVLSRLASGGSLALDFDYPGFDALWKLGPYAKAGLLFAGGLLVGFGTRMAGGCTSGHAIMGAPALQKTSILAMCVFMGTGIGTTWLLHAIF